MACKFTKDLLTREDIDYTEKNISDNDTHRQEVELMGFKSVPITAAYDSDGQLIVAVSGFDMQGLQALKELGGVIK